MTLPRRLRLAILILASALIGCDLRQEYRCIDGKIMVKVDRLWAEVVASKGVACVEDQKP